jgi:hypothetical protein
VAADRWRVPKGRRVLEGTRLQEAEIGGGRRDPWQGPNAPKSAEVDGRIGSASVVHRGGRQPPLAFSRMPRLLGFRASAAVNREPLTLRHPIQKRRKLSIQR